VIGRRLIVRKRVRSTSPAVSNTVRHSPLLIVWIVIPGMEVEAILNSASSAPVLGERVGKKLGI